MSEDWDIRKFHAALKESGLTALSHEDGWTIMETTTAEILTRAALRWRAVHNCHGCDACRAYDALSTTRRTT